MITVLVAVDETEASVEALRQAARLFGADANLLAINVGTSLATMPMAGVGIAGGYGWGEVWTHRDLEAATVTTVEDATTVATNAATKAGVPSAQPVGETGDPVEAILGAAEQHGADVIVVGSHERSWLSRLFDRSVADGIVRSADRPVLVVS
jgi:nucleotide-binding universal stress UspA family protein